jgi:transcriptional regulator with XRE-family HTH domain
MDLGITQKEVARRMEVDPWTVINWERGKTRPASRALPRIVQFLGNDPLALSS